jgi:hypothetical protein
MTQLMNAVALDLQFWASAGQATLVRTSTSGARPKQQTVHVPATRIGDPSDHRMHYRGTLW